MSGNQIKSNPKPQHGAGRHGLLFRFVIFMVWVAGIGLLLSLITCQPVNAKPIATNTNNGYYIDLSKLNSDLPSRKPLAFFVPDNSPASQAVTIQSSTALNAPKNATREQYLIFMAASQGLLTNYEGLTLQNKTAERRICRAVSVKTESKTSHPISLLYSVIFTQNLTGAIHHG